MGDFYQYGLFFVVYIWAGVWIYRDMSANDPVENMKDPFERAVAAITISFWPVVVVFAPNWAKN